MMAHAYRLLSLLAIALFALFPLGCGGASMASSKGAAPNDATVTSGMPGGAPAAVPAVQSNQVYAERAAPPRGVDSRIAQAAPQAPPGQAPPATAKPDAATSAPQQTGTGTGAAIAGPLLIYTANVQLAVFEAKKGLDAAEKLARESGGYLVRRDDHSITFRVPSGKFEGVLADVLKLGDVLHRDVSVRDVTDEFYDLQVRLKNLEAMRDRFEELLKRAQKVEEALAVERELERVAGEIERLKGRLKLLKELIAFSTITIEFQARPVDQVGSAVKLPFPWLDQLGLSDLLKL
jgi:hypothetical protein